MSEDCIVDGGTAKEVPCDPPGDPGTADNANAWRPARKVYFDGENSRREESFLAAEGQQVFTLTEFSYARFTHSLAVFRNGLALRLGEDWLETDTNKFSINTPCSENDVILAVGYVKVQSTVDVRDTDIFLINNQELRGYAGTETTIYVKGVASQVDGGGKFFQKHTGYAPGTFVDDNKNVIVPTGGDGSVAWLSTERALVFSTVTEMLAYTELPVGYLVQTEGYYSIGDGGANLYRIVAENAPDIDGGAFIDLTGSPGYMAKGLFPGNTYSVKQWGVVGDGVTNDSQAIQNAIDFVSISLNGGDILFPPPAVSYKCNITLRNNIDLIGVASSVTLIPNVNAPVIVTDPTIDVDRATIQGLIIDGTASKGAFTAQDGIRIAPDTNMTHSNIKLLNCKFRECGNIGIALLGGATTGNNKFVSRITIIDCVSENNTKQALKIKGNVRFVVSNNSDFLNSGVESVAEEGNVTVTLDDPAVPRLISFENCTFETTSFVSQGTAVYVSGVESISITKSFFKNFFVAFNSLYPGAAFTNGNVVLEDNRFDSNKAVVIAISIAAVRGFKYDRNAFTSTTSGSFGLALLPGASATIKNVEVGGANSWGGLTTGAIEQPFDTIAAGNVSLSTREGHKKLRASSAGVSLNNIFDELGGITQFVPGKIIILSQESATNNFLLRHGTGNVRLAGGADFNSTNPRSTITLMALVPPGSSFVWVETSRSILP